MAIHDHIYGRLLPIGVKSIMLFIAHVKVARAPHLLLEIATTVNQDIMALITLLRSCSPVILSGMVQSVRVKVVAAALLHGSLWI